MWCNLHDVTFCRDIFADPSAKCGFWMRKVSRQHHSRTLVAQIGFQISTACDLVRQTHPSF